jgi:hypothetical protein
VVAAGFDASFTKFCDFTPMATLTGSDTLTLEEVREYTMRVNFKKATGRSVLLGYNRPSDRHCDVNNQDASYDPLGTCGTVSKTVTLTNNQPQKPFVNYDGLQWTPLALKNNTYEVTLRLSSNNSNKKVQVVNGLKLKVSGQVSDASPNDELLEGAEFPSACVFETQTTLVRNVDYTCTFTAEEDGFIHIPLKKAGNLTGNRSVAVTITNLSQ